MKKALQQEPNIALRIIATIVIIIDTVILTIIAMNITGLGWWGIIITLGAISSIGFAVMAIKRNEPAWLLLDLILPN